MVSEVLSDEQRKLRMRRRIVRFGYVLTAVALIIWGVSPWVKLGINTSSSVDGWLFLMVKNTPPERGELIGFWPPENDFFQEIWFVKYIAGMPGDIVERHEREFFINGQYIGDAKTESMTGIPLEVSGVGVIPPGHYFVWTPHKDSFDSRYAQIGWIPKDNIIGRTYRLI